MKSYNDKQAFVLSQILEALTCIAIVSGIGWFGFKVLEYFAMR